MLIIGGAMQTANRPNFMANSLSGLQTASAVLNNLENAGGMVCRLETIDRQGLSLRIELEWQPEADTKVTRTEEGGIVVRRVKTSDDPELGPARDFLTPATIADLLTGRWEAKSDPTPAQSDRALFLVQSPGKSHPWLLTLDPRTYYPTGLEYPASDLGAPSTAGVERIEARFHWEPGESRGSFLFRQPDEL
jgi:hypothetical protein